MRKIFRIIFLFVFIINISGCGNKQDINNEKQLSKQVNADSDVSTEVNKEGSTCGNILNQGIATSQGEWIYYFIQNGGESSPYGGYIHKEKLDGSERQKINIEGIDKASDINVIGKYIYFTNAKDSKLYKVKLDGKDLTKLSDDNIHSPIVVGEWIYYVNKSDNYRIYKMKVDGSNVKNINNEQTIRFNIVNNYLYYITKDDNQYNSIYKIKNDGTDKKIIIDKYKLGIATPIIVYNDYIYYTIMEQYSTNLYRCKEDGTDKKMILENLSAFNIKDNTIYYSRFEKGLFKCSLDGKNIIKISDDATYTINLVENYIYYYMGGNNIIKMKLDGTSRERI